MFWWLSLSFLCVLVQALRIADWRVCLSHLKSANATTQRTAAINLSQYVEVVAVREMSPEAFSKFEAEMHRQVFALVHGEVRASVCPSFVLLLLLI